MSNDIHHDLPAPPLNPEEREQLAETWLKSTDQLHGGPIDVLKLLDSAAITLCEWPVERMLDNEVYARPQVQSIFGRPSFVSAVHKGERGALMKLAHEFAHCVLHRGPAAKPLKAAGNHSLSWISGTESQENQAWQMARAIAIPRNFVRPSDTADAIAARFRVPIEHAVLRLKELQFERRKCLQDTPTGVPPKLDVQAARYWKRAAIDANHDPDWYRLSDGNFLISIAGYNRRDHRLGWYVYCDRIYANDEWDQW